MVVQCGAVLFHNVGAGLETRVFRDSTKVPIAVHVGTAKLYISLDDYRGLARSLNCGILASRFSLLKLKLL